MNWGTGIGALALMVVAGSCRNPESIVEAHGQALGTWQHGEVGAPMVAGTWSLSGTTHTLEGSGADIWGTADGGHFAYQTLTGDCAITARVSSLENTNSIAKAGVMIRDSLAAGSKNAFALLTPTGSNGFRFQNRITVNGTTARTFTGTATPPNWVRLVRSGANVSGYWSTDGVTFTAIGPTVAVGLGQTVLVGLAVTSHSATDLATAVFDSVSFAPPPPTGLTATAGNAQVSLAWTAAPAATGYNVWRANTSGGPYTFVRAVTTTSHVDTGLVNGATYYYVVTATNADGESAFSAQASAIPVATFASQDIGAVGAAGSWTLSGGTHTVKGAGADIYGTADAFRFVHQTFTGDVTVVARVGSLTATNVWTKAAVMIREDLTAGARNVATLVSPTSTNKYRLQVRGTAGGSTTSTASADASNVPAWLKLERVGSTFTSSWSGDGSVWHQIGNPATVSMAATVRVGLAVTSHVSASLATATFTNVSIGPPALTAPTGVSAAGQNNQVYLSWNPTPGASSYRVKRSDVTGGPYALVQQGIAESFFVDTGRTNGTPYFYVVTAANAAGEGPPSAEVSATPTLLRPSVRSISPVDGATGVATHGFVSTDLLMPNVGGGVDVATLTSAAVFLQKASDGSSVSATLNTSGGGDVVVLQPTIELDPQTLYNFTITAGLQDLTGAPFVPFTSSFTTGDSAPPPPPDLRFDKIALPTTAHVAGAPENDTIHDYTSVAIEPGGQRLYATSVTGQIYRWAINADGTLGPEAVINTIITKNGGARAVVGLTFDPASTQSNLILWVTHGDAALKGAADWSGKLSKLSGASLATYQDVLVNLPRSYKDHMTNSIAFKAGEPNVVYFNQGSMNAMGAPDNAWAQRAEHLLSATVLRLDLAKLPATLPLDVKTNDADPTVSGYNPFAAGAPLTIFGSGVRNAYDLVWHSSGELYVPTNGSAASGNSPATPSPLPSACTRRIDGLPYTGPAVPAITSNPVAEDDFLFRVVQNGSYGHPNPSRCEWVLNGGNPTSSVDPVEVTAYPVGTQPDRNWRGAAYVFGQHYSPNGVIEWKSNVFPQMKGKLLVIRYSGGDDIIVLTIDPVTKNVSSAEVNIPGFTGFSDPLDIIANDATGDIYVTEHVAKRITLLRPHLP